MNNDDIEKLLEEFKNGKISSEQFLHKLKFTPYENLNFARLDYHRQLRVGIPEVIFCEGKSIEQVIDIVSRMNSDKEPILATRVSKNMAEQLQKEFSAGKYNPLARTFTIGNNRETTDSDSIDVCLVTAGTSDIPVAEEARETLDFLGVRTEQVYDVGVAGLHRFLGEENKLETARVLIVIAGMEGALASVVGGLFSKPIIAVPTSIGYGTSFSGLSPLLSMLNACSSGITVVNIDNGYGAACAAYRIIRTMKESK